MFACAYLVRGTELLRIPRQWLGESCWDRKSELGAQSPNRFQTGFVFDPPLPTLVRQLPAQLYAKQGFLVKTDLCRDLSESLVDSSDFLARR